MPGRTWYVERENREPGGFAASASWAAFSARSKASSALAKAGATLVAYGERNDVRSEICGCSVGVEGGEIAFRWLGAPERMTVSGIATGGVSGVVEEMGQSGFGSPALLDH